MAAVVGRIRKAGWVGGSMLLSFLLLLALLVASMVVSMENVRGVLAGDRQVEHSYQVLALTDASAAALSAAESAARGYNISGRAEFAMEFKEQADTLGTDLGLLKALTADNPDQQKRLRQLGPLIAQRLKTLRDAIERRRRTERLQASNRQRSQAALRVRAEVSTVSAAFRTAEVKLLARRTQKSAVSVSVATFSFVVLSLVAIAGLVGFYVMVSRLLETQARLRFAERVRADELSDAVAARTAELVNANRDLESFSYSVSHDLRSPLRAVAGFSRVLQSELHEKLAPEQDDMFDRVVGGCRRMGDLIDALLNLSHLSRSELQVETVDLTVLAESVVANLRPSDIGRAPNITIEAGLTAVGDPRMMRILLANLLGNAVKFSSRSENPVVRFGRQANRSEDVFFVVDNGVGFDPSEARRLFEPFVRLHREVEFHGTGIGLAICERIVRRHGGQIWAESQVGTGATFLFTLLFTLAPAVNGTRSDVRAVEGTSAEVL